MQTYLHPSTKVNNLTKHRIKTDNFFPAFLPNSSNIWQLNLQYKSEP